MRVIYSVVAKSNPLANNQDVVLKHRRRRRQCVVSEDRSVAPEWPLMMAERHRSAGEWLS